MTLARLASFMAISTFMLSAQATEFNSDFLNAQDKSNIDLSTFNREGYVAPGNYLVDLYLNDRLIQRQYMMQAVPVIGDGTVFCVTPAVLDMLALKDDIVHGLGAVAAANGAQCIDLNTPDSRVVYSAESQTLTITLPQAWLQYLDPDWVPPSRWGHGVNGAILDYNLLASRYMPHQGLTTSNYSLFGTAGLNLGAWRLRSDYQYNRYDSGGGPPITSFSLPQTYLFRPLPQWRSKLTLGQTYLSSAIFDAFRFAGVTLASDERMLPPAMQGYAPQISGIANSNAQLTVSQAGRIVYQTRVPPGPFVVPALSQNISGNLDVTLQESYGATRSWQVNTASVPFMTRKDNLRYQLAAGRPLFGGPQGNKTVNPGFIAGEATWGALNNTSLYGGLIATAGEYQALALGAGQNLGALGALSVDVTRSDARLGFAQRRRQTGYSFRVNYAKTFDDLGSTLAFMGYRFSSRHFVSMREYIARSALRNEFFREEKQSYTLSYSQYIRPIDMSVSLSLSRQNYWNDGANNNYMLSISKIANIGPLRNVNLSLSLSRNLSPYGPPENQVFATLSIPLGDSRQLSYGYQRGGADTLQQSVGYTDYSSPHTTWGLSASDERNYGAHQQSLMGNIQSRTPYGRAGADFTLQPGQYRSAGLSWYGSLTATAEGAAFGPSSAGNEPRMMVDTDGIADVPIDGGDSVTNRFGIAVVNGVSSYHQSNVSVDLNALPDNVDVSDAVVSQVLTEGAIGYTRLNASRGEQVLGNIELADGRHPPLGAIVLSTRTGMTLGMVGDQGLAFLTVDPADRDALTVTWNGTTECRLALPAPVALDQGPQSLPCR